MYKVKFIVIRKVGFIDQKNSETKKPKQVSL